MRQRRSNVEAWLWMMTSVVALTALLIGLANRGSAEDGVANPDRQVAYDLGQLRSAARAYMMRTGAAPRDLEALTEASAGVPSLTETEVDPWGTDYHLGVSGDWVEVRSAGPDRALRTSDDHVATFATVREPTTPRPE